MKSSLRVGIISANWGAQAHLPAWRSLQGVEVKAICTSRPATAKDAAEHYGLERAYHDFREMAADPELDLVDVGSRPPLRYQMVLAALEHGKHVYNGIPFAVSLEDARHMDEKRRKIGVVGAVDAYIQAVPALVYLKELIEEGSIGQLYGFRVCVDMAMFTSSRTNVPDYVWFGDPANGASAMRNFGSHVLHLLVHLFGPIESVVSDQSLRLRSWPIDGASPLSPAVPDTAFSILRFASGLAGQVGCVWSMIDGEGFRLEVWGSRQRAVATAPFLPQSFDTRLFTSEGGRLGHRTQRELDVPKRLKTVPGVRFDADEPAPGVFPIASVFRSICDEVAGRRTAAPNFQQALHVQEAIEAAAISARENRWVKLSDL